LNLISIFIFALATVAFTMFTWFYSIKAKRLHGIPRFFAFEFILLLTILNIPVWFIEPLSWNQIISWLFLLISIIFALSGFMLLRIIGRPEGDFENTTKLVEAGIFRFIRHPLYASLIFFGTGVFLKSITMLTLILALLNFIALIVTATIEEKEMENKFGNDYINYIKRTKMFIPYIF
jgi:protein-S-isoprenylcysteine O-methyltransferase Ste14